MHEGLTLEAVARRVGDQQQVPVASALPTSSRLTVRQAWQGVGA